MKRAINHSFPVNLSPRDTNSLKGLAIIGIALHNYFHWLPGTVKENEFNFEPDRFSVFLTQLSNPSSFIQAIFSFTGHYGVGIFICLSAYGLAVSHPIIERNRRLDFFVDRYRKIFPTVGLCMFIWILSLLLFTSAKNSEFWLNTAAELTLLLIGVQTIMPGRGLPTVGPWWFIPFILQFYILWAFFHRRLLSLTPRQWLVLSIISTVLVQITIKPLDLLYHINLRETPLGYIPEIAVGILSVKYKPRNYSRYLLPILAVWILSSLNAMIWTVGSVCITAFTMIVFDYIRIHTKKRLGLAYIGALSLPIFLLNGFTRNPFVARAKVLMDPMADLYLAIAFLAVTILISYLVNYTLALWRSLARVSSA